jgi:uncharacterized glyoxalase superfamily protein PhnB
MNESGWQIAPVLRVRDVRAAAAYYRERLGFDCPEGSIMDGVGDEGAVYAIARRGAAMVHLGRARTGHAIDPGQPPNAQGAYVYCDDVKGLFEDLSARGADLVRGPEVAPYGLLELVVRDPDGYYVTFGEPVPAE